MKRLALPNSTNSRDVHINGREGAMSDGTADCASEGEARIKCERAELGGLIGLNGILDLGGSHDVLSDNGDVERSEAIRVVSSRARKRSKL